MNPTHHRKLWTSVMSADKRYAVCQDIHCVYNAQGMPWQTADLMSANTTGVSAADTTDVVPADTTHVLPADKIGVGTLKFANYF